MFTSIAHAGQVIHAAFTVTVVSNSTMEMGGTSDTLAPLGSCALTQCPTAAPTTAAPTAAAPTTAATSSSPTAVAPTAAPPPPTWGAQIPDSVEAKAISSAAHATRSRGLLGFVGLVAVLSLTGHAW